MPAADSGQLFEASDLEVGYDETSTTEITCLDDAVQIDGSGAEATDGVVTITQGASIFFGYPIRTAAGPRGEAAGPVGIGQYLCNLSGRTGSSD